MTTTEVVFEEGAPVRIVRFASGAHARETMVTVDDERRRLVWSIRGETVRHHNGVLRVEAVHGGCGESSGPPMSCRRRRLWKPSSRRWNKGWLR